PLLSRNEDPVRPRALSSLCSSICLLSACGAGQGEGPTSTDPVGQAGSGGSTSQPDAGQVTTLPPRPERVDLVFMLDNSRSMDVKHALFADAASQLIARLRNPDCVDAQGQRTPAADASSACAAGQTREFVPVTDINVAIITSSLGDAGDGVVCDAPDEIDMAHTMGSTARGAVSGMNAQGFLEWRPGSDAVRFQTDFSDMIRSVGQTGCGYEASLEAWYRFLIEPEPYTTLTRVACSPGRNTLDCIAPSVDESGSKLLDQTLLAQRAAFLRPDSLLLIVSLSDENDCSLRIAPQSWLIASPQTNMPSASSACAQNPNDACCYSCGGPAPSGCTPDPLCESQRLLTSATDPMNLRCLEQKRRFGTDFLYPTERYVRALTESKLCPSAPSLAVADCPGETIDNPLFAAGRPREHVSFGSIVGVPWQRLASTDASGAASFKTTTELTDGDWANILGSPRQSPPVPPVDPFMIESTTARSGVSNANPINGREYDTALGNGTPIDLEFACIFPLAEPIDCALAEANQEYCDCYAGENGSPLCEATPGVSSPGTLQYHGKAYPGLRHLEVLHDYSALGGNATLASICPQNATDTTRPDYGYRPAMQAILGRIAPSLR
ncbi:MAG TPA: hypothetical protein VJU61_10245, partial [Polyangiaceae bacterium]|nr:hypothetical protein [Polyangiaceae bacterium]